jgi:hypothetical protein
MKVISRGYEPNLVDYLTRKTISGDEGKNVASPASPMKGKLMFIQLKLYSALEMALEEAYVLTAMAVCMCV